MLPAGREARLLIDAAKNPLLYYLVSSSND